MSQDSNKQSPKKPKEEPGFNWKSLLLVAIGLGLFSIVLFNPLDGETDDLTFNKFKELMSENRVVLNEDKMPFEIKAESPFTPDITGYYVAEPLNDWEGSKKFKLNFNPSLQSDAIEPIKDSLVLSNYENLINNNYESISLNRFKELVKENAIVLNDSKAPIQGATSSDGGIVTGTYKVVKEISDDKRRSLLKDVKKFKVSTNAVALNGELNKLFETYNIKNKPVDNTLSQIILSFLPIIILVALLFFFFRHQMKASGKGPMSFGKSKAKLLSMDGDNKVTFKDVAGIQEAKEELYEIVDYLKDPQKFQMLGGSIPKGVLMVGSPGTGKTLLARAIAGEADVPFFSISGSDFVEMFVGVGASRVRDMFEQGRKNAPCLIFIDEIDAVGRHRGHGMGGGHDEREQTLNALLVEMDGFESQKGVIIIAATNRPDVLDPALLRPGRFDRQVTISLPDVKGREQILDVHIKKIKLADGVELGIIARGTPGFSGAELANLINEAALLAARKGLKAVSLPELEEARDKVRWGRERRSLAISEKEKENTAYHEAGHAILNVLCDHTDPLHKVTIIPRGPALGMAMFLPEEDKFSYRVSELKDSLVVAMGGRVAEEMIFGNFTNGASGDIRQATGMARQMVCSWGMSPSLGMVEYGESEGEVFLARDMNKSKNYSEATARKVDEEIKRFIDEAYDRAKEMLTENKEKLELVAKALIEYETLDGDQIRELMSSGEMKNPPRSPEPPELPNDLPPSAPAVPKADEKDDGEPFGGEIIGAPA